MQHSTSAGLLRRLRQFGRGWTAAPLLFVLCLGLTGEAAAQTPPRINAPYVADAVDPAKGAVFWFGHVDTKNNHTDVRVAYNDEQLLLALHVFDRQLWYDEGASPNSDLTAWDAATLFLQLGDDRSSVLTNDSYRFILQLHHWQERSNYQQAYRGNGGAWARVTLPFTTYSGWRGDGLNGNGEARGWVGEFIIPFAALGLSASPSPGTEWGIALVLHDRDAQGGTPIPDQRWPLSMSPSNPASWARIRFGVPTYTPQAVGATESIMIRHGVDGTVVTDAHVGGHSVCGDPYGPEYFDGWGSANYAGFGQINIQNQWDVADWPCFSKYFVTFPLDAIPVGSTIVSATLTMHLFGSAGYGPGDAKPSNVQLGTLADEWAEATVTWNNAPLLQENYAYTWVQPVDGYAEWPGVPVHWDASRATAQAVTTGEPLRLALYSTDKPYHSGKYFWSSDANADARPMLHVVFGPSAEPGFALTATPATRRIQAGGVATYTVEIVHDAAFEDTVAVVAGADLTSGVTITVAPTATFAPPGGQTAIVVRHTGSPPGQALTYTIPITATGNAVTRTAQVHLHVDGTPAPLRALHAPLIRVQ